MVSTCLACIMHRTLRASPTNWEKTTHSKQVSTSYSKTSVLEINFSFVSSFSNVLHLIESLYNKSEDEKLTDLHLSFLIRFCWLCCLSCRIFQALFAAAQQHFYHIQRVQFSRIRLGKQIKQASALTLCVNEAIFSKFSIITHTVQKMLTA